MQYSRVCKRVTLRKTSANRQKPFNKCHRCWLLLVMGQRERRPVRLLWYHISNFKLIKINFNGAISLLLVCIRCYTLTSRLVATDTGYCVATLSSWLAGLVRYSLARWLTVVWMLDTLLFLFSEVFVPIRIQHYSNNGKLCDSSIESTQKERVNEYNTE